MLKLFQRNIRLAAGGESQVFEPDALAAKRGKN